MNFLTAVASTEGSFRLANQPAQTMGFQLDMAATHLFDATTETSLAA